MHKPDLTQLDCDTIQARLAEERSDDRLALREGPWLRGGSPRRAAVLLPLYQRQGEWHLLFIRRAEHESDYHSGQVGFPGGGHEPGDASCTETALREAREEIGLDPGKVRLLGELPPFHTVSGFLVTPVVGCIPWPQPLHPDAREVARIFSIPLAWLALPGNHRVRPYPHEDHPEVRELVFFERYDGELLWGVSGRITLNLLHSLRLLGRGR
jgi:8-oxo-dGTP pyrophosphatase MutT (NUDIX family)